MTDFPFPSQERFLDMLPPAGVTLHLLHLTNLDFGKQQETHNKSAETGKDKLAEAQILIT